MNRFVEFMRGFTQGKTRVVLSWVMLVFVPFLSEERIWWPGILSMALGVFLRCWSSGLILKDNELSVNGPYAFTRNPLYLGSFLIGTGAALAVHSWLFLVMHTIAFFLIYGFIIEFEEKRLTDRFGAPYVEYRGRTARFFSFHWNFPGLFRGDFRWKQFRKNKGFEAIFTALGLLVLIKATAGIPWKLVSFLHFK